jgi:hypothetical protein
MRFLDHRGRIGTALTSAGIARFHTKKDASAFAKEHGWFAKDAMKADNVFWQYWVVGQCTGPGDIRYLSKEGTTIDDKFPGFW